MKKVFLFTVLFSVMAFVSCDKEDDIDFSSEIVGTWQFSGYQADVRTNSDVYTSIIKKKLENREHNGAGAMTFTADKKVFANSTEIGTYSIDGNNLTITDTNEEGGISTVQIDISDNILSVSEDKMVFYQGELEYFGLVEGEVLIHKLILTTRYTKK